MIHTRGISIGALYCVSDYISECVFDLYHMRHDKVLGGRLLEVHKIVCHNVCLNIFVTGVFPPHNKRNPPANAALDR